VDTRIRRSLALGAAAAAAASLTMLAGVAVPPPVQAQVQAQAQVRAQAQAGAPGGPPVNVWITTANGQQKLTKQAPLSFSASPPANLTVTVDPTRTFQAMTGFGGSLTDSSAAVLYSLSPSARDAAMNLLFDPATGDGLDFLRQPIGA
jgi:glucosylceramidase